MRADRPLLVSAAFLGAGLWITFRYGTSGAGIHTALPWSSMGFRFNLTASGPAAIGGAVLIALGALLLIWALLTALAWHASLLFNRFDDDRDFLRIAPGSSDPDFQETPESVSVERRFL
ncbi:MAG: hypothetical protein ACRD25_11480 [Terracidiphilus sp.]